MTTLTQHAPAAPARAGQSSISSRLELSPLEFEKHFAREPFLIGHHLGSHPLFELDRLLETARNLPPECIEYNAGNLPVSIDAALTPRNGLSPEETIRRIQECRSWLVLKYVERDPDFAQLLNECLAEVRPHSEPIAPGMTHAQAFVFITSPRSVTPYHIDPEHNFLLQVRGSKEIRMLDGRDRSIVSEEDLESFYCDRGRNLKLKAAHEQGGWTYNLQPGQGLHFPVTYPHWVRNGEEVSISFSITFRTPDLDRRRALYQHNDAVRQKGGQPRPVGESAFHDRVNYLKFRVQRKLSGLLSGKKAEPQKPAY